MYISVKSLHSGCDKTLSLEITPDLRVENLKSKIYVIEKSMPIYYRQYLVYDGQHLEDGHSLEEYGIENNSTILIVYNPAGVAIHIKDVNKTSSWFKEITVNAERLDTISCVKKFIDCLNPKMLKFCQPLSLNGYKLKVLDSDTRTLKECGIESEAMLKLSSIEPDYINISVGDRFFCGRVIHYKVKTSASPKTLYNAVCEAYGLTSQTFRLETVDADQIIHGIEEPGTTLSDYELCDGESLFIFRFQIGGGARERERGDRGCESISVIHKDQVVATFRLKSGQKLSANDVKTEVQKMNFQDMSVFYNNELLENHSDLYFCYPASEIHRTEVQLRGSNEPIHISVDLPEGFVFLDVLPTETIKMIKGKIEALRSCYPVEHQVLVHPSGDKCYYLDDDCKLLDVSLNEYYCPNLVMKGKIISIQIKGAYMLNIHLEYFDKVEDIKEKIHKAKKIHLCQQQLVFKQKELKDEVSLSESGLHNDCSIVLSVLQPNERILISELLEDIPDKYYEFAHLLGLSHTTVECFRIEYRDSPHRCLIAVLNHWVRNYAEDVSWKKVVDALEKLPRKDVAKRIRFRYLHEESKTPNDVEQSHDSIENPPSKRRRLS